MGPSRRFIAELAKIVQAWRWSLECELGKQSIRQDARANANRIGRN
jgi:hypothetical protein